MKHSNETAMVVPMIPFHLVVGTPDSRPWGPHTQQLVIQLENKAASEHEGGGVTDGSGEKQDSDAAFPTGTPFPFQSCQDVLGNTCVCEHVQQAQVQRTTMSCKQYTCHKRFSVTETKSHTNEDSHRRLSPFLEETSAMTGMGP